MPTRSDVTVDFFLSPRVVRIAEPSTELTIQDLHDTLRDIEDEPNAMQYADLISTAGKEAIGGGLLVGLTSTLKNAVIAFDARKVSTSSGAVTTPDLSGFTLIDSGATFVADNVKTGAWVVNTTDGSVASVISVDSETQITTDKLADGSDNEFAGSDVYKIWNVIQVEVTGGNLVAQDVGGSPIDSILPTMGTQVVRTGAASATLQELLDIQHSSFNGGVTLDSTAGVSGTTFPTGTPRQPVDNLVDAKTIAAARGLTTIFIVGDFNFLSSATLTGFHVIGAGMDRSAVDVPAAAVVTTCEFSDMTLTGALDNGCSVRNVLVDGVAFNNSRLFDSLLKGTLLLTGSVEISIVGCASDVPGAATPILDLGGDGPALQMRGYDGGLTLRNKTGSDDISIDLVSGQVILEATVTDGTIFVRGVGKLTDNSTGTTIVVDELLSGVRQILMEKIARNELITDPVAGTITILDDDGVTILLTSPLFEDTAETQPYRGLGVNVRKKMT